MLCQYRVLIEKCIFSVTVETFATLNRVANHKKVSHLRVIGISGREHEGKETTMNIQEEFEYLVSEHIDGTPSAHSTQRLDEILKKDPKLRREYQEQLLIHRLLQSYVRQKSCLSDSNTPRGSPAVSRPWFQRVREFLRRVLRSP